MANYKPHAVSYVTFGNLTQPIPSNQPLIFLQFDMASGTAEKSLQLQTNYGTAYAVTTGYTLHIIGIEIHCTATGYSRLYQADSEDLKTVQKQHIRIPAIGVYSVGCHIEIASGKYITYDPVSAHISWVHVVGYETLD